MVLIYLLVGGYSLRICRGYSFGVSTGYVCSSEVVVKNLENCSLCWKMGETSLSLGLFGDNSLSPPPPHPQGMVSLHFHVHHPFRFTLVCGVVRLSKDHVQQGEWGQAKTFFLKVILGCTLLVVLLQIGRWGREVNILHVSSHLCRIASEILLSN